VNKSQQKYDSNLFRTPHNKQSIYLVIVAGKGAISFALSKRFVGQRNVQMRFALFTSDKEGRTYRMCIK
jgi:hypothetical protein